MTGFGHARELTGQDARSAFRALHRRNESLRPLLSESSVVIFTLHIDRYHWVQGYTRSVTFEPGKHAFE